jgi:glycosyltransferase involved in cell wall biosynthesis
VKNVLIVSYYFPPSGGPGVQRALKFARYLPENGYRPLILTVPETAAFPVRDESLLAECPPPDQVFRSPITEFYGVYRRLSGRRQGVALDIQTANQEDPGWRDRWLRRLRGALFIPDGRMGWVLPGTRTGVQICREHGVAAVLATGPPFSAHWIAARVGARTGLPFVLDFRDPWVGGPRYIPRPRLVERLDARLEHRCVSRAARVTTAFPSIRHDLLRRHPGLDPGKFTVITNGYDAADFEGIPADPPREWTLTHTGTLFVHHIPTTLFEVLRAWLAEDPERSRILRVRFVGRVDPAVESLIKTPPLDRIAGIEGYVPHRRSVEMIVNSHLLLLLVVGDPMAGGVIPGKVFEYIGSGTPILALAPEGEAADLIRRTRAGRVVAPGDAAGIRRALDEAFLAYREGRRPFGEPDPEAVRGLTRQALTARLAGVLDAATGRGGAARRPPHAPGA